MTPYRFEKDLVKWSAKWPARWEFPIIDSFLYRPKQLHDRLKSQHGLFTINIGKSISDVANRVLDNEELISPRLSSLDNKQLIVPFIEKVDFYLMTYNDEAELNNTIKTVAFNIKFEPRKYVKSPIFVLLLISENGGKSAVYISDIQVTIFSYLIHIPEDLSNAEMPVLIEKNKNLDFIYASLIAALRGADPVTATKILNFIENNTKDEVAKQDFALQGVYKITIPAAQKKVLRRHLSAMGINHNTLYPELHNFFQGLKERFYDLPELSNESNVDIPIS